jgi:hypothetical protein
MARLAVRLLFILIYFIVAVITKASESFSHHAIRAIIDQYYTENVHEIEIINFGVRNGRAERTIHELSRLENPSMPMRVSSDDRENVETFEFKLKNPSILLFDSPDNFKQTLSGIVF